ncbi:MAG: DUF86 domain-containing protein [Thermoflavifilum sp.]|nr:DUF86 domain-containing protein [Thermoflavifilum sp.]MCL6514447.1 DUF86 domain-containing protein [Alicyclobacillus sp.]
MFITEELQKRIDGILQAIEVRADWLARLAEQPGWSADPGRVWAAERALHVAIECVTDAASDMIDALVMRDPGSYADIVRVLMEEGVVSADWFHAFEPALTYRDKLVRRYRELTAAETEEAVRRCAPLLRPYCDAVRRYLGMA